MSQRLQTTEGTLVIPGAYASYRVQNANSNISTTGVLFLVGESAKGKAWTLEAELADNAFGSDQEADVIDKYGSGPIVDAFRGCVAAANDPDITGSFQRCIIVKTNPSVKASSAILKTDASTNYGTLADKSWGKLGNLIYYTISSKTAETKPTTGSFTFLPNIASMNISLRANGGSALALTVSALTLPSAFVSAVDGLAGIAATGGADRVLLTVSGTLAVAASGNNVVITRSIAWAAPPVVGDTLYIPAGSAIVGAASANAGSYVVTAIGSATVSATKLMDASGSPAALTAPVAVSATSIAATTDLNAFAPVVITTEGAVIIDGAGKSLEVNELTTGTDVLSNCCYTLNTTKVTWISKAAGAKQLLSASEYSINLNVNRQSDNVQEVIPAGGDIALKIGYTGTTASAVVADTTLTITVTGGSGTSMTLALKDYPTLNDLATYINAQTGYSCAVGTASLGQYAPAYLDDGTFTFGTTFGNQTGRLKVDAYKFFKAVKENSILIQFGTNADPTLLVQAASGLPNLVAATTYLAGGALGATTDALIEAGIDALESVDGNFLVPLFSRDASADIADALTDSSSTYTIDTINAYSKTHVLKMSTLKRRRKRQAFLSKRDSFANLVIAANNLATHRCSLAMQDMKDVGLDGIVQYQPWFTAAKAAAMQAAGFYKAIVNKGINCSGVLQAAGDWKDSNDSNVENALDAGLLIARKSSDGGFTWISDQTTYSKDNNFVLNSIQAVYAADVIAKTLEQRIEKAFIGQSTADITAALVLAAMDNIMMDFLRLKLIAPSDDAPRGFRNTVVRISGPAMAISTEIKLAGAIYFAKIDFLVSQVTQTAGA